MMFKQVVFVFLISGIFALNKNYVEKIDVVIKLLDGDSNDQNWYIPNISIKIGQVNKSYTPPDQAHGKITFDYVFNWEGVSDGDLGGAVFTIAAYQSNSTIINLFPYKKNIKVDDPPEILTLNLTRVVIDTTNYTIRMEISVACTLVDCASRNSSSENCISYLDLDNSVCVKNGSSCVVVDGNDPTIICEGRRGTSKDWDWPCGKRTETPACYENTGRTAANGGTCCASECSEHYEPNTTSGVCVKGGPCLPSPPLSGGTVISSTSQIGDVGNGYSYEIWNNGGQNPGKITLYGVDAAFRAEWNNSGDYLARVGLKWGTGSTDGLNYKAYGDIKAEYSYTRAPYEPDMPSGGGVAGDYSYIGIYGWMRDPLVEYYIVDDWFGNHWQADTVPVGIDTLCESNASCEKGELIADDAVYKVYQHERVGQPSIDGTSNFSQYFSVRQTIRQCGTINITSHFQKWEGMGFKLGKMYEAKILVEAGGGVGWADFSYATLTASNGSNGIGASQ